MESTKHVYQIGGIKVEFPYKAYGPQLAYMGKVITTLERAFRDPEGHCNALLESPTGSGKSLALLCSALAWQEHRKNAVPLPPTGPANLVGGGFIPEEPTPNSDDKKPGKKTKPPTIFFATRTHSQIAQIVHELRKTTYRVPMAILAARKHYCTNQQVCKKANIDEECKILLKDPNKACPQFKNVHKLKNNVALQKGGCLETHDIEDLVNLAHLVKGCAYFAARAMSVDAQIVFCPYSYILNPIFRKAMEVDVRGAIVIFDEAHNIEDMSREAGSIDLDTRVLEDLRNELENLRTSEEESSDFYQPLSEMIQELLIWFRHKENSLSMRDTDLYCSNWTGLKAMEELQAAGISTQSFPILIECAMKAGGAAADPDPEKKHLSGRAASTLEGLFSVLHFMLSKPEYVHDYQLVLQKSVKWDDALGGQDWVSSISFWCLNPAVVFDEIATAAKSVILTSGTLSPMGSFASELGAAFNVSMEAPHIINMDTQILVSVIPVGPADVPLNASYKHADTVKFQDALGMALEQICSVVPDGALVFFPSYKLLHKVCSRWKATGQWKRISEVKNIFVETRGNTEKFEDVLNGYYAAIKGEIQVPKSKRHTSKPISKNFPSPTNQNGAAFLAVCRGKVSEGINFADENARVVVIVGIPFPNLKDVQVNMKKSYNDGQKNSKQLLGGDQWYCQQAFRALNQAVGRCIRHRRDYGAILLLDERFNKPSYVGFMSKWLRNSVTKPRSFEAALHDLQGFFSKFKDVPIEVESATPQHENTCLSPLSGPQPALNSSPQRHRESEHQPRSAADSSCVSPSLQSHQESTHEQRPAAPHISDVEHAVLPSTATTPVSPVPLEESLLAPGESAQRDFFPACCKCSHPLGAFRLPYNVEILPKSYLAYLANVTTSSVAVLVADASSLDSFLFGNPWREAFLHKQDISSGIWVQEDGCVYKPIVCGWCTDSDVILGAQVLAADPPNMCYAGKVLLFTTSLKAADNFPAVEIPSSSCTPKRPCLTPTPTRNKLKLRKTE